jgi:hypothetical protein
MRNEKNNLLKGRKTKGCRIQREKRKKKKKK